MGAEVLQRLRDRVDDRIDDLAVVEDDLDRARETDQQRGRGQLGRPDAELLGRTVEPQSSDPAEHDGQPHEQRAHLHEVPAVFLDAPHQHAQNHADGGQRQHVRPGQRHALSRGQRRIRLDVGDEAA